jgi:steroid 5-alpha reductase family enzyme
VHPLLLAALLAFVPNLLGFLNGFLRQTDRLTDLLYGGTFALAAVWLVAAAPAPPAPAWLLAGLVTVWGLRLAGYLYRRILHMGHDARFDAMRPDAWRLGGFWFLQAVSIWIILLPLPLVLAYGRTPGADWPAATLTGAAVWAAGWLLETVADAQKFRFKKAHPERFMDRGLWSRLRHPNYAGEILAWIGVALAATPLLDGWALAGAWVSPLWIATLLVRVSGIPLLEASAEKRYGQREDFRAWVARTDRLIPGIW